VKKFNKKLIKKRIKNHYLYKRTIENRYFLIFLTLLIFFILYSYISKGFVYNIANNNLDDTVNFVKSYGQFSWLVYFVIISICIVLLIPIPPAIIYTSAGIVFSPIYGFVLTLLGNFVGATISYNIAKRYGGFYFERFIGRKKFESFNKYATKYGAYVLFILRLNPLTSSDIFNYLAGMIKLQYKRFIISTILGLTPMIFILNYFGNLFIKDSPVLRLIFLVVDMIYLIILFYAYYKIGKEKIKEKIKKFRK
jgi:uncharacterized membrane protein YdjX (TVP38/TMEM64 family)